MSATGVIRRLDPLGRVVVPCGFRRVLGIELGDQLEIVVDGKQIVLRKFEPRCVFCASDLGTSVLLGKTVCAKCRLTLAGTA